jgi:CrcB protein
VAPVDPETQPARGGVLVLVLIGGTAGGLARYAVSRGWPAAPLAFPWATLVVNLSGAFALGLLLVLVLDRRILPPAARPLLGTGFLGAWTTYSTLVVGADRLFAHGRVAPALAYLLASLGGGPAAAALGARLAAALGRRRW